MGIASTGALSVVRAPKLMTSATTVLAAAIVLTIGFMATAAHADPGDPPLETPLRLTTNGRPATVVYHADHRYDLLMTGSHGHTQHYRSGLWWTEPETLRHCFVPDVPSGHAGQPYCKKPGHYMGNLFIPVQR
jgi:hypothetical protein